MPLARTPTLTRLSCAALIAGGLGLMAAPAFSQPTVEEVTVTGRMIGEPPQTLSRAVPYGDLDLRTEAGQNELRMRIRNTAEAICRELNAPPPSGPSLAPTCESQAVSDAMPQMHAAIERAGASVFAAAPALPAPAPAPAPEAAPAAPTAGAPAAAVSVSTVTNGPVPDTVENRRRYGQPLSRAGRRTEPRGN